MNTGSGGQKGFLLMEIVLALGLTAALLAVVFPLLFSSQLAVLNTVNRSQALAISEKAGADASAAGFNFVPGANVVQDNFTTSQEPVWLSDYAKNLVTKTSYNIGSAAKSVELDSLLVDPLNLSGRDTCNLYFEGSWAQPQLRGIANLSPGNPATGIDVNNNLAFVSSNSSTQSLEDLSVFDVADLNNPVLKSRLNTGPGLAAITLAGNYIFAANDGVSDQLEIINVSNPNSLGPVVKIKVPNFNGQPSDGKGSSIYYYQNKIFLGLTKNNGPELHVYDVSNPQFPVWIGSFETNTAINGIYIFNNIAYLALADGKLLDVLDAGNPSNIFEASFYSPAGSTSQSGQSVAGLGDKIFLGRAGGLPNLGYKELYMLDKNSIAGPIDGFDLNATVHKIFARNDLLFLATGQANKEIQVFTWADNILTPLSGLDLSADANALDCEGGNLFLAQEDGKLQVVSLGS